MRDFVKAPAAVDLNAAVFRHGDQTGLVHALEWIIIIAGIAGVSLILSGDIDFSIAVAVSDLIIFDDFSLFDDRLEKSVAKRL